MAKFDISVRLKALTQEYVNKIKAAKDRTSEAFSGMSDQSKASSERIRRDQDKNRKATDRFSQSIERATSRIKLMVAGFLSFVGVRKVLEGILGTGGRFESLAIQLESVMGSIEGGERAFAWIREFTKNTPFQLDQVTQGFVKLKAFGIDPMNGTYQAIADQAAKLGGGQEKLNGIILAVGQAWAKQKLQGEEILQLVERGVPVYDLLAEATGRNATELRDMQEAGELGRKEIALLIQEMGKAADGSAAKNMTTLGGIVSNLKDQFTEFLNEIAEQGALDYFKDQLTALANQIKQMTKNGELKRYAKEISDAIIGMAEAIKGSLKFIYDYSGAIKAAAAALLALKFGAALRGFLSLRTAIANTTGSLRTFTKLMLAGKAAGGLRGLAEGAKRATKATKLLSRALIATGWGAAAAAIGFVTVKLIELKNQNDRNARQEEKLNQKRQETADIYEALSKRLGETIKTSQDLIKLEQEGIITFDRKNKRYERTEVLVERAKQAQADYAKSMTDSIDQINRFIDAEDGAAQSAVLFKDKLKEVKEEADTLAEGIADLTDQEFAQFADGLQNAIDTGYIQGAEAVEAKNAVLAESFRRLNVDTQLFKNGMTSAGAASVAALDRIIAGANTTKQQLIESFSQAVEQVGTEKGVEALRQRLIKLGEDGRLSAEEVAAGMTELNDRIIKLNSGLNATSRVALEEFKNITNGAKVTAADIKEAMENALDTIDVKRGLEGVRDQLEYLHKEGVLTLDELTAYMEQVEEATKKVGNAADVAKDQMDELFNSIQSASTIDQLNNVGIAAAQAWEEGTISASQYLETMQEVDAKKSELLDRTQQQIDKERELGDAAQEAGDKQAGAIEKVAAARSSVRKSTIGLADAIGVSQQSLAKAQKEMNAFDSRWKKGKGLAFLKRYNKTLEETAIKYEKQARREKELGDIDMKTTREALKAVEQGNERVARSANGARASYAGIREELAELQGDEQTRQRMENERRRLELLDKISQAEAEGNDDAVRQYKKSLGVLRQINQIKLDNLRTDNRAASLDGEKATQVPAIKQQPQVITSDAQASGRTVTVAFESKSGDRVEGQYSENDVDKVINVLQQAGATTK